MPARTPEVTGTRGRASVGRIAAVAVAALLAGCGATGDPGDPPAPTVPAELGTPAEYARALFDESNARRVAEGELPPLEWSDCLAAAAAPRAAATIGVPELTHQTLVATCTPGVTAGENLTRNAFDPDWVVGLWWDSPAHHANIVNPAFVTSGIGCVAMSFEDPSRAAVGGEPVSGMACSQLFEGE